MWCNKHIGKTSTCTCRTLPGVWQERVFPHVEMCLRYNCRLVQGWSLNVRASHLVSLRWGKTSFGKNSILGFCNHLIENFFIFQKIYPTWVLAVSKIIFGPFSSTHWQEYGCTPMWSVHFSWNIFWGLCTFFSRTQTSKNKNSDTC